MFGNAEALGRSLRWPGVVCGPCPVLEADRGLPWLRLRSFGDYDIGHNLRNLDSKVKAANMVVHSLVTM